MKNVFKKEKCYNTIMTTANLQAVQGISFYVRVKFDPEHGRKHRPDYHPPMVRISHIIFVSCRCLCCQ